jgi:hypothetical protein
MVMADWAAWAAMISSREKIIAAWHVAGWT